MQEDKYHFCFCFQSLCGIIINGTSLETLFWQFLQAGYFSSEIFSVRPVEPRNSKLRSNAPTNEQFHPRVLTLNKQTAHQIEISQKKFGWREALNNPVFKNPYLYYSGRFQSFCVLRSSYFFVWNLHCCQSATTSPIQRANHNAMHPISHAVNSFPQAYLIGAENKQIKKIWQQEVKKKFKSSTKILGQFLRRQAHLQSQPPFLYPPFRQKLYVRRRPHNRVSPNIIHCLNETGILSQCCWYSKICPWKRIGSSDQILSIQEYSVVIIDKRQERVPRAKIKTIELPHEPDSQQSLIVKLLASPKMDHTPFQMCYIFLVFLYFISFQKDLIFVIHSTEKIIKKQTYRLKKCNNFRQFDFITKKYLSFNFIQCNLALENIEENLKKSRTKRFLNLHQKFFLLLYYLKVIETSFLYFGLVKFKSQKFINRRLNIPQTCGVQTAKGVLGGAVSVSHSFTAHIGLYETGVYGQCFFGFEDNLLFQE